MPVSDRLRDIFRRILQGVSYVVPREGPALPAPGEADEARSQADQEQARRLIEHYQRTQFNPEVEKIATRLAKNDINSTVARSLMLNEIRALMITAAAAGAGGFANLTADDRMRIEAGIKRQAAYLDNWLAQAERQPLEKRSEAGFRNRARMYGGSGGQMVDETIDRNRFKEFPDLPFHAKDRTLCKSGCACGWVWANVDREKGNADVHWRLNYVRTVEEHCLTCLLRASTFNPLMIRNWEFVNLPADLSPYLVT